MKEKDTLNNTGNSNTGNRNNGDWNTGDWNTGNCNTGDWNTGNWNTGNCNTGNCNTGNSNTGNRNTGDWNTGNRNTGNRNTGDWNTGNCNTGYFNTDTPKTILCFGKETSREKWDEIDKPKFLYFELTKYIWDYEMTDEEKKEHPEYVTTGGYLKEFEYKEAFINSFERLDIEERKKQLELLKKLPNFDKKIFFEISGIDIDKYENQEMVMTIAEIEKKLGVTNLKIKKEGD